MSNFYNQGQSSTGGGQGGFYNSGAGTAGRGGGAGPGGYGQQQPHFAQSQPSNSYGNSSNNNFNQWQQSSSSSQFQPQGSSYQQNYQPQNQSSSSAAAPNYWTPAPTPSTINSAANLVGDFVVKQATGNMTNEAVLDSVFRAGTKAFQEGGASIIPGLNTIMLMLRSYFAVDNRYVKRKIQKVLFPFTSKQWKRMQTDEGTEEITYALPYSDENAPDLYLPVMSLITYCLLSALCYGTAGKFNPEVIADVTTKCFFTQVLEVSLIRCGFYMMQAPVAILDLFSYTGYKYLGLNMNMLIGLACGHFGYGTTGFYLAFLWTASAAAFFMLKTMAFNIPSETASTGPKKEVMILAFAGAQAATMWFVGQTKYL